MNHSGAGQEITTVRPRARCHACNDLEVVAVCSRCARLLCSTHDMRVGPPQARSLSALLPWRTKPAGGPETKASDTGATAGKKTGGKKGGKKGDGPVGAAGSPPLTGSGTSAPAAGRTGVGHGAVAGSAEPGQRGRPASATDGAPGRKGWLRRNAVPDVVRETASRPGGAPQRHFCVRCVPNFRPYDAELLAAATTAALGAAVLPSEFAAGVVLAAIGGVRVAARAVVGLRKKMRQSAADDRDLTVNPHVTSMTVRETISGAVAFTAERTNERTVAEVVGSVKLEGTWSRKHRERLDRHRRRSGAEPLRVEAGHLVLGGPGRVEFRPDDRASGNGGAALVLRPLVAEHPILTGPMGQGNSQWKPEYAYDISPPEEDWSLPIWVTPSIVPDSGGRALQLELQWSTRRGRLDERGLPLKALKKVYIDVPADWGDVESMTEFGDPTFRSAEPAEDGGPARRRLMWEKFELGKRLDRLDEAETENVESRDEAERKALEGRERRRKELEREAQDAKEQAPSDRERKEQDQADRERREQEQADRERRERVRTERDRKERERKERRRTELDRGVLRLIVRFSEPIELDHELKGRIEAEFEGAVSGLTRVDLHRTDGERASVKGTTTLKTVAEVDLVLSLKGLRYQDRRSVPDRSNADDADKPEYKVYKGVVPDHHTIALLTDLLADQGYYVKHVHENPPQPGARAGMLNRFWDLEGRKYSGVYPINFHVVLTGEELHKGMTVTGNTTVRLTVHGSFANDEMERCVVEEWRQLWTRVALSMDAAGGGLVAEQQPLDASGTELSRLRNLMVTVVGQIKDASGTGRIKPAFAAELTSRITDEFDLEQS